MDLIDAFESSFKEWDRLVHVVGERQWDEATPCSDWNVRDLVNHLTGEHLWAPHLLNGESLAEVGDRFDGDVVGDAPVAVWEQAGSASRSAFHRKGALQGDVHVTGGTTPASEYAWQMTTDLAVHGWDLARGIGVPSRMPDELADAVYGHIAPQAGSWHEAGIFDPPVSVPDDAVPQDRLVALLGRRP